MFAIALAQVQDISLNLLVPMAPPVKPVKVHLDDILSLQHVNCTMQLGAISKPAESESLVLADFLSQNSSREPCEVSRKWEEKSMGSSSLSSGDEEM